MNEQLSMDGFSGPERKEVEALQPLMPQLRECVAAQGCDPDQLTLVSTQGYSVVYLSTFTAVRLHSRGNQHYLAIPTLFSDMFPPDAPRKEVKSDPQYPRLMLDEAHPVSGYTDFLLSVVKECVNRYPKEFDCCSRYEACSDAGSCIHPDKSFALGCGYRKILHSGKIYCGKNRNVD